MQDSVLSERISSVKGVLGGVSRGSIIWWQSQLFCRTSTSNLSESELDPWMLDSTRGGSSRPAPS